MVIVESDSSIEPNDGKEAQDEKSRAKREKLKRMLQKSMTKEQIMKVEEAVEKGQRDDDLNSEYIDKGQSLDGSKNNKDKNNNSSEQSFSIGSTPRELREQMEDRVR